MTQDDLLKIRIQGIITDIPGSIEKTLNAVERLAKQYCHDTDIFKDLSLGEIFYLVSKKITYEKDPINFEFVMRPEKLLQRKSGDCDDKTTFILAIFYATWPRIDIDGFGYSIVAQKGKANYHHIFPFVIINKKIKDFDATYDRNTMFENRDWGMRKNKILRIKK